MGPERREFIEKQKMFLNGTTPPDGRVNVFQKRMVSLPALDANRVVWLYLTDSGNESAVHVVENDRLIIMFCAFEGSPLALRLGGHAQAIYPRDPRWSELYALLSATPSARRIFDMLVDIVQKSYRSAMPFFHFNEQQDILEKWAQRRNRQVFQGYWEDRNQESTDGNPTNIIASHNGAKTLA